MVTTGWRCALHTEPSCQGVVIYQVVHETDKEKVRKQCFHLWRFESCRVSKTVGWQDAAPNGPSPLPIMRLMDL